MGRIVSVYNPETGFHQTVIGDTADTLCSVSEIAWPTMEIEMPFDGNPETFLALSRAPKKASVWANKWLLTRDCVMHCVQTGELTKVKAGEIRIAPARFNSEAEATASAQPYINTNGHKYLGAVEVDS